MKIPDDVNLESLDEFLTSVCLQAGACGDSEGLRKLEALKGQLLQLMEGLLLTADQEPEVFGDVEPNNFEEHHAVGPNCLPLIDIREIEKHNTAEVERERLLREEFERFKKRGGRC